LATKTQLVGDNWLENAYIVELNLGLPKVNPAEIVYMENNTWAHGDVEFLLSIS